MSSQVLFLHGPAASGKHTIGTLVAEKLGWPLFHNHLTVDLVTSLFDFGTEGFVALREAIWRESFAAAADAGRSFVFTFNPERTVRPALIGELQELVEARGGEVLYVELACSDAEVERRIGNASRQQFGKLTDVGLYRDIRDGGGFDFPPLPEAMIVVDTEARPPEESAGLISSAVLEAGGESSRGQERCLS